MNFDISSIAQPIRKARGRLDFPDLRYDETNRWEGSRVHGLETIAVFRRHRRERVTISAAAKKLHISSPPLSHQLMQLETELGVQLITRGARRSSLTDAGRILYKRARQLISLADAAEREIVDFRQWLAGVRCI